MTDKGHLIELDREAVRTLRSLVHSIEVSLSGLDKRIKKELEVVEVAMALSTRSRELLNEILKKESQSNEGP